MAEFNASLEQEVAQMEQALAEKRRVLEAQKETGAVEAVPQPKEILHEIIGEQLQTAKPVTPPTQPVPTVEPPSQLSGELQSQVQQLVNAAFTQSINTAIKQVRATGNPALIDAFHDALTDELYQQLVERGKLEKI